MACGILDPQPGTEPSWAQGCESTKSSPLDHQGIPNVRILKSLIPFQKIWSIDKIRKYTLSFICIYKQNFS